MAITFTCPNCKASYTVERSDAGKKAECHQCGQRIQVPLPPSAKTILGEVVDSPHRDQFKTVLGELPPIQAPPVPATAPTAIGSPSAVAFPRGLSTPLPPPPSPRRRHPPTGLIAIGIVAGFFVSIGCLVGVLAWRANREEAANGEQKTIPEKGFADLPISKGSSSDDVAYIAGHRWWWHPLPKRDVEELVRFVIETNAGDNVLVNRQGEHFRYSTIVAAQEGDEKMLAKWTAMRNDAHFVIACAGPKRPDREAVLRQIRRELDESEYKDGPASQVIEERARAARIAEEQAKAAERQRKKAAQIAEDETKAAEQRAKVAEQQRKREENELREGKAIKVTATKLAKDYADDPVGADRVYKGRVLEIDGAVSASHWTMREKLSIEFFTDTKLTVKCEFPKELDPEKIKGVLRATVRGRCKGIGDGAIVLPNCLVVTK